MMLSFSPINMLFEILYLYIFNVIFTCKVERMISLGLRVTFIIVYAFFVEATKFLWTCIFSTFLRPL